MPRSVEPVTSGGCDVRESGCGLSRRRASPFIKRFRTRDRRYVYDVNTNHILEVDPVVHAVVGDVHRLGPSALLEKWRGTHGAAEVRRALGEIRRAEREGLFRTDRPGAVKPFGADSVEARVANAPCEHLILNVTEDCNLRCRHCVYGGTYPQQRGHSTRTMPWEVARKALDAFLDRSRGVKQPHIGFYGGEPLLNLALIRRCVLYVGRRTDKRYHFGLTTNGTLLSRTARAYLSAHAFNVVVSLDGPQDAHDAYRIDRAGRGSWDRVLRNLEALQAEAPRFFRSHVSISAVVHTDGHLGAARRFFEQSPLLRKLPVTTSFPVYTPTPLVSAAQSGDTGACCEHCALYQNCESQLRDANGLSEFLKGYFQREMFDIHYRGTADGFGDGIHINGCCLPGRRRLFVSCDGTYFVCERLDNGYPLGHVDTGVMPERVAALVDEYARLSRSCRNCWAVRFCTTCYAGISVGGRLDAGLRRRECASFRRNLERLLVLYHEVVEARPRAFSFLRHVTQS